MRYLAFFCFALIYLTEGGEGPAGEQHNPLELLVEEEVVEAPEGTILAEWVRAQIRVVRVNRAVDQVDLLKLYWLISSDLIET